MSIQLPVETEVLEKVGDLKPRGKAENNQIIIEFDMRQRDYHNLLLKSDGSKCYKCFASPSTLVIKQL